jgi:excisionase family DNA binding protein
MKITRVITPPLKGVLYHYLIESIKIMPETKLTPPLMTVGEVAKRSNVTNQIVYRWIARGELDFYNIGTGSKRASFRISEEHLESFLNDRGGRSLDA